MTSLESRLGDDLLDRLTARATRDGVGVDDALREAVTRYLHTTPTRRTTPPVTMQPLIHVENLAETLSLLEVLGAHLTQGSASGDWAKVELDGAELSVLAHPPNRAQGDETVELTFESHGSLHAVETSARAHGVTVETPVTEFGFGRQLVLRSPDGTRFKINELRSRIE